MLEAGKGDVYDSSIWLGNSPTYTPLHRDPNPNLFVQLAGKKVVRLFPPHVGRSIFAKVQEQIGGSASETMRGEEMMQGAEKKALEVEVWKSADGGEARNAALEAEMGSGDGLFIPKGWWHSVKSFGEGMTGSVRYLPDLQDLVIMLMVAIGQLVVSMSTSTSLVRTTALRTQDAFPATIRPQTISAHSACIALSFSPHVSRVDNPYRGVVQLFVKPDTQRSSLIYSLNGRRLRR